MEPNTKSINYATLLLTALLITGSAASAAIFPDQIGPYLKSAPSTIGIPDQALYDEYGLEATETAEYKVPATSPNEIDKTSKKEAAGKKAAPTNKADVNKAVKHFSAVAWRLHDSTGALALFQFRRPSGAVKANIADLAVRTSDGIIFAYGNYVFQITGGMPEQDDLLVFLGQLTKLERSPLPALAGDLPDAGLVPNSERYILGPVSLDRFESRIPPSVAAFHLGAEGQLGKYETPKGLFTLVVFSYPTFNMARDQAVEMRKIAGAIVKRTGPLVLITIAPPDLDAAERVLGKINYQASVAVGEKVPVNEVKSFAGKILSMFVLAGIVLIFCVVAGVAFGGFKVLTKKFSRNGDPDAMTVLNLDK